MAQDDRFFTLVCCAALIITGVVFLWTHNGLISFDIGGVTQTVSTIEPVSPNPAETTDFTSTQAPAVANGQPDTTPAAVHAVHAGHNDRDVMAASVVSNEGSFAPDKVLGVIEAIVGKRTPQVSGWNLPALQEVLVRRDKDGRLVVAPGTHKRYDVARETITSLDGPTVAAACDAMERSLSTGLPGDGLFRAKVVEAIDVLLDPELPNVELDMVSRGTYWGFADPGLDDLALVQKHMLLMGTDNQRAVRATIEEIRNHLGGSLVKVATQAPETVEPGSLIAYNNPIENLVQGGHRVAEP